MLKQFLEAGRIVGTHGVRGELRVEPWCDSAGFLTKFRTLYWDGGARPVRVLSARPHKNLVLLRLEGCDTVEQGDLLRGKILWLDRKDAVLPRGRYFIEDLLDARVLDAVSGRSYGVLKDVLRTGANDVYSVEGPDGREYLVPAIPDVVREIDPEGGRVLITPMKGIFDDED